MSQEVGPPGFGDHDQPMPPGGLRFVCPACNSKKPEPTLAHHNTGPDSSGHYWSMVTLKCDVCDSDPKGATKEDCERWGRGQDMRKDRLDRGVSLYHEALSLGISSADLSALERGKRPSTPLTSEGEGAKK